MHEDDGKKFWLAVGLAPTALQMAAALLAPSDVIDRLPLLGDMVELLAGYVPSLHGYISLSAHAQVAALFFVLGWLLLPLQTVTWLLFIGRFGDFAGFVQRKGVAELIKLAAAWVLGGMCIFAGLFWIPQEWSIADSWGMNRNRISLAFFGSFGFLAMAIAVGVVVNTLLRLVFGERNG